METGAAVSALIFGSCGSAGGESGPISKPEGGKGKSGPGFAHLFKEACEGMRAEEQECQASSILVQDNTKDGMSGPEKDAITGVAMAQLEFLPVLLRFAGDGQKEELLVRQDSLSPAPGGSSGEVTSLTGLGDETGLLTGSLPPMGWEGSGGPIMTTGIPEIEVIEKVSLDLMPNVQENAKPLLIAPPESGTGSLEHGQKAEVALREQKQTFLSDRHISLPGDLPLDEMTEVERKITVKFSPENTASSQRKDVRELILAEANRSTGIIEGRTTQDSAATRGNEVLPLPTGGSLTTLAGSGVKESALDVERKNPVTLKELLDQVVEKFDILKKPGQSEVSVVLKPEVLGKLTIKLSLENHQVTARFIVENHVVKQVMEANLPQLRAALEASGLKLDRAEVGFYHYSNGGQDFQGQSGFFQQRTPVFKHTYRDSGSELRPERMDEVVSSYAYLRGIGAGMLDCVV